ncbi:MAG: sigma-70 family RNA polymerase sigma factor, partial [Eubacteriales bacterium]|nr:sigma-70 family RNA polymerase sigma factor [Eubacteriales bacterium]
MFLYLAMIDSDADKSKFEILYSEYKNLMYYTANRILHNSSDAEDVVHQAFLKVIEILDTISSPRCHKTRALLVTITEHKAIDLYREKQRRNVLPLAEEYI